MLSRIGRAAIRRVGAAPHQSTNRILQSLWHQQRVSGPQNADLSFNHRQFSIALRRAYAAATKVTKPKAKVTKPKATAQSKSTRKLATKKPAKKPARKPVKKVVKKTSTKKKVAAKPRPKRKVLTEAQKEKKALLNKKADEKALKATALTPPKTKASTAWMVFSQELLQKQGGGSAVSRVKEASAQYKSLTTAEIEHFNHVANQNKAANELAYKKWIESHTPDEIRLANNARNLLNRRLTAGKSIARRTRKFLSLHDPRIPKQPTTSWARFCKARWSSGDFKGIQVADAAKQMTKEWKALSASEQKAYSDEFATEKRQYVQEYITVFGREPGAKAKA